MADASSALAPEQIAALLAPFLDSPLPSRGAVPDSAPAAERPSETGVAELCVELAAYLDLLLRWNARTNLTAIRNPEEIVRRHFGESLFAARVLSPRLPAGASVLDLGSGAGFPGLPIQLFRPDLRVALAESQGKKASFLREAVRTLAVPTEVFAARVESMPAERRFDAVVMRAVDRMDVAVELGAARVAAGGWLAILGDGTTLTALGASAVAVPGRDQSFLEMAQR